jgi:Tol biopolymer transport system component
VWVPDSSGLVYSWRKEGEGENLYNISLDGKVTKFTQFENAELTGILINRLLLPSWSPNGRYLIFGVKLPGQDIHKREYYLFIWDNKEKIVYKPCLPNEANMLDSFDAIWSFDGNHLIMGLPYQLGDSMPDMESFPFNIGGTTVIMDLTDKTIYELPDKKNRGEFTTYYGDKVVGFAGWVNWEIP